MTLERAIQVLQLRQRWRESERKDRLQCWPGHELNSIEESRAVDILLIAIAALEADKARLDFWLSLKTINGQPMTREATDFLMRPSSPSPTGR